MAAAAARRRYGFFLHSIHSCMGSFGNVGRHCALASSLFQPLAPCHALLATRIVPSVSWRVPHRSLALRSMHMRLPSSLQRGGAFLPSPPPPLPPLAARLLPTAALRLPARVQAQAAPSREQQQQQQQQQAEQAQPDRPQQGRPRPPLARRRGGAGGRGGQRSGGPRGPMRQAGAQPVDEMLRLNKVRGRASVQRACSSVAAGVVAAYARPARRRLCSSHVFTDL